MCYQDHSHGRSSEALSHHQRLDKKFQQTSSSILRRLCHQMSSTSILGNLYFQATGWCAGLTFCTFFRCVMWIQDSITYSLVAQGRLAVPERHLFSEFGKSPSGGDFSQDKNFRWQGGRLKVFISWKHLVEKLLYQHMFIFNRSN